MERPQFVLILLIAAGVAMSGFFFSANQRGRLQKEHAQALEKRDRKIKKLEGEGGADAEGINSLMPGDSTKDELQEQVTYLEGQLDLHRDENARLLRIVDRLEVKLKSAGTEGIERTFNIEEEKHYEKVKQTTARSRELEYKKEIEIVFTDWDGMSKAVSELLQPQRSDEENANRSRAYAAMGFVTPATDVNREITHLLTSQLGAALYVGDNKILFNRDGNLNSVHDRTSLAVAFDQALQDQNFNLENVPPPSAIDDDRYAATEALLLGDASIIKLRHMMYDMAAPSDDLRNSPTALSREDYESASPFVREYFTFPYTMGSTFCEALHERGKWKAINAAIQNPPLTTAQILNPELYDTGLDFAPSSFDWPAEKLEVKGQAPLWNNVAGELGISVHLNRAYYRYNMGQEGFFDTDLPPMAKYEFRNSPGSHAAKGWRGDRYLVYPNGDGAGGKDHVYWRSKWASANDAAEFFHGARVSLAQANQLKLLPPQYQLSTDPADREPVTPESIGDDFKVTADNGRELLIRLDADKAEVTVISAGDKDWFQALESLEVD